MQRNGQKRNKATNRRGEMPGGELLFPSNFLETAFEMNLSKELLVVFLNSPRAPCCLMRNAQKRHKKKGGKKEGTGLI
jgi:hypothetical protein